MGLAYSTKNKRTGEDFTISSVNRHVSYEGTRYKIDIQVSKGKLGLNPFKRKKVARILFAEYCTFNLEEAHKAIVNLVANLSNISGEAIQNVMFDQGYRVVATDMGPMARNTVFLLVFVNP